jgi:hypothetical protein
MGFLSKINKKLGFSKGTKERVRALKRREALGLNPKYVEDPMGPIMSPSGRFNQSALDRRVAEMKALNPGMNFGDQIGYTRPNKDPSMPIAFNDPSFRMPQKRGGGFGNLGEAIRRLQEQGGMGMPRMEGSTDMGMPRMEGRPINQYMGSPGGTPGFYDNMRENMSPGQRLEQRPNFGMEQMPIARRDPSALERIPMGNMPDFSQIDMSQLDLSGIPQSISQMNLPQMPEGLPSIEEIQGNRRMPQMRMGEMQPRVMMAVGGSAITALSAIAKKIKNMPGSKDIRNKYFDPNVIAKNNLGRGQPGSLIASARGATINDRLRRGTENAIIGGGGLGVAGVIDATQGLTEPMAMANLSIDSPEQLGKDLAGMRISIEKLIELASQKAQEIGAPITEYVNRAQRSYEDEMEAERMQQIDSQEGLQNVSLLFNQGGEAMKRYANGGEIEAMLGGMGAGEQEAMGELEQMAPEMEMIDQLVMMVAQMIQQGAGEEQVISFLREQGLDDEDIGTVLQLVAEMAETEEVAAQNEIGADLEQLG